METRRLKPHRRLTDAASRGARLQQAAKAANPLLMATKVTPETEGRPSIEVLLHAVALKLGEARFVGHTHTAAVNALLCSDRAEAFAHTRIFPDQVVVCGPDSVYIPYSDPGVPLGRLVDERIRLYRDQYGEAPRILYLQNHGPVVLGQTAAEVEQILAMCTKAARIYAGACGVGEPVPLSQEAVDLIAGRPDEAYRRKKLLGQNVEMERKNGE